MNSLTPLDDDSIISSFVRDGFIRINGAFSRDTAKRARDILWEATGCDPQDRATWTRPVVRLDQFANEPFQEAANSPVLREAFDTLVGPGRWLPRMTLGTFPIRFPSDDAPGDDGWHVDMSFGYDNPDFMEWRINIQSDGRALLMLFLFSDVGENDAPTCLRVGSHLDVARQLAPAGPEGLTLRELVTDDFGHSGDRAEAVATGDAGTVYLCHPFLVHRAQRHIGSNPRFMAQPPLMPRERLSLLRPDGDYSAVERAIIQGMSSAE